MLRYWRQCVRAVVIKPDYDLDAFCDDAFVLLAIQSTHVQSIKAVISTK